jgi:hypothetical protein
MDTPPRAAVVVLVVVVVVVVVNFTAAGILAVIIVVAVVFVVDVVAGAGVIVVVVVVVVGVVDVVLLVTLLVVVGFTVVVVVVPTFVTAAAALAFPFDEVFVDPNSAAPTFETAAAAMDFPFDEVFVAPNSAAPFVIPDFAIDAILAMVVVVAVVVVVVVMVEVVDVLVVVVVIVMVVVFEAVVVVAVGFEAKKERAVNEARVGTFAGSVALLAPRAKPSLMVFGTKAGPCLNGNRAVFDVFSGACWWLTGVGWRRLASVGEPSGGPVTADFVGVECSLMMPRIVGLAGRSRPVATTGSTFSVVKVRVPALFETFLFFQRRRPFFLASVPGSESLSLKCCEVLRSV